MLRHASVLDCHEICGTAVRIVHSACPSYVTSVVNRLSTDRREMEALQIRGKTKAKQKGEVAPTKIRTVLPLPILFGILDVLVAKRINEYADRFSASLPYGFLECAQQHRQVLDMTFPAALAIERGMDRHSRMTVAQQDIEKYYDNLRGLQSCQLPMSSIR